MDNGKGSKHPVSPLVQILDRFNRKERFCLLSDALGDPKLKEAADKIGRPFQPLNDTFRSKLEDTLGLKSAIPKEPWWAFDYHLDWLFAALEIHRKCGASEDVDATFVVPPKSLSKVQPNDDERFTFNIEDCDLIVAFDETIILVEAKIGPWKNSQLENKMKRLGKIEGNHIHYVLASPNPPIRVITKGWPQWAVTEVANGKPNWATKFPEKFEGKKVPLWMELPKPPMADKWLKVSRCNAEGNIRESDGKYWCVSSATA